ncbi:MAG: multicopper oxidase domain-containing protein [Methylococcaceae bacterium]
MGITKIFFWAMFLYAYLPCVVAKDVVREYWIAADEVVWDYAPSFPVNLMSGKEFNEEQRVFVGDGESGADGVIGRRYLKAIYRQYSRDFMALSNRTIDETYLGLLGPIIRAEVGDQIVVHFRNNTRFPVSLHAHGMFYNKDSEGAMYADGTKQKADDHILPQSEYTYTWQVTERAGPGPNDSSSIIWPYHSHVNTPGDVNAGLIGVIIITRKGLANVDGSPKDIDREFVTLFNIFDENTSNYLATNISEYTDVNVDPADETFVEGNLMHGMNGYLWGNNQGYVFQVGERVRWHIIAMGTEVDIHTAHWHGITLLHNGNRVDTIAILPAATKTLDFQADNSGIWMYHCHVNDHIDAGMMSVFTVMDLPREKLNP